MFKCVSNVWSKLLKPWYSSLVWIIDSHNEDHFSSEHGWCNKKEKKKSQLWLWRAAWFGFEFGTSKFQNLWFQQMFWKTTPEGQMDGHEHRGLLNPHSQRGHLYWFLIFFFCQIWNAFLSSAHSVAFSLLKSVIFWTLPWHSESIHEFIIWASWIEPISG